MRPQASSQDAQTIVDTDRRQIVSALAFTPLLAALGSCSVSSNPGPPPPAPTPTRTWEMGFSPNPSRPDAATLLRGVDQWSTRSELAAIHDEMPWTDLLAGQSAEAILARDKVPLVTYLRGKGLQLMFVADLTDGLSRGEEAPQLRKLGRSISEPGVQRVYQDYVLAAARILRPEILALAAETNLTRALAPSLYAAEVQAANAAAADLHGAQSPATLVVSVQVETAWGWQTGSGAFVGIATDLADFPFLQMLGLSSYPYFAYAQPEDLPPDYYSRLLAGRSLPALVTEGGWASATAGNIISTPEKQARYLASHARLLDSINARGLIQLLYADIDLSSWPSPIPANLPLFTSIGLTDSDFHAKPALTAWDSLHSRKLVQ